MHLDYSVSDEKNDIALIEIDSQALFTDFTKFSGDIVPVCLQTESNDKPLASIAAGWGVTPNDSTYRLELIF